jgi:glycosyltransferase involved in cell wall biosynthesis
MKILLFHPTLLPPRDYGGVERVVLWLARGLAQLGHEVWVAARTGSVLPPGARLVAMEPPSVSALDLIRVLPAGIDLVHFMAPPGDEALGALPCPAILTVHGNGKAGERFPVNSVFLSLDHATRHGAREFVYNGIDPSEYRFDPGARREWYLFLSKTSWRVKNVAGAIRLCRRAGAKLAVAGGNRPLRHRLEAALRPSLRWEGPVAGERKARLLAEARALVFPVEWPEPFGLVVAEALISGTPVLAPRKGSLPELVPPDVGAILEGERAWIEALRAGTSRWSPERCRQWAMERFHYMKMAASYEAVYARVIRGESLHEKAPVAGDWRSR